MANIKTINEILYVYFVIFLKTQCVFYIYSISRFGLITLSTQ